jgi:hypothetical protein
MNRPADASGGILKFVGDALCCSAVSGAGASLVRVPSGNVKRAVNEGNDPTRLAISSGNNSGNVHRVQAHSLV